ncbi:MAG: SPOR domain-containing protein [Bacteroidaceae bacterium]|nr:SPOR domain-containing protein [Bacteroidaceae bacterium]
MENLVKYTTRLVAQYNCVIIPGLGAFLAHNVPASYNIEGATFMPPHRALGFNPQVTIDDALLVSEYIYAQHLSYDEASKMLHDDINALRRELSTKGTVCFGELGTFTINIAGEISFDQAPNGIDDPYNFGFEPLVIQQLSDVEKKEIVIKRSTFKRYVALAAAVILMFFFVSPVGDSAYEPSMTAGFVTGNNKQIKESIQTMEAPGLEGRCEIAPVADTVTETIITAEYAPVEPTEAAIEEVVETATSESAAEKVVEESIVSKRFSIIVASTPNEQKAQLAIEELSAKHEADYTVVQGDGRHRIAYGTYSSNKEAVDALSHVKGTFPDAWILSH